MPSPAVPAGACGTVRSPAANRHHAAAIELVISRRPAARRPGRAIPAAAHARRAPLMAIKSTIFRAGLQIADMDRGLYATHQLTLARHPSETDERMMVRLLAFALRVPAGDDDGALVFARGLSDTDEPDLWQHSLDGRLRQWIEVGQPDERRLARACGRADRVCLFVYSAAAPIWWAGIAGKVARLANLEVWQLPAAQSQALATLAERSMQLQVTVQDGQLWVGNGDKSVEIDPVALKISSA
jgi:uncharacterized protein YaeQ